jgi:hypothetical protein
MSACNCLASSCMPTLRARVPVFRKLSICFLSSGLMSLTVAKKDGKWLIAAMHFSSFEISDNNTLDFFTYVSLFPGVRPNLSGRHASLIAFESHEITSLLVLSVDWAKKKSFFRLPLWSYSATSASHRFLGNQHATLRVVTKDLPAIRVNIIGLVYHIPTNSSRGPGRDAYAASV